MAALTPSSTGGGGVRTITPNTLTASDTFTYNPGAGQVLVLHNPTGGALSPTLTSPNGAATAVPGGGSVAYQSGLAVGSIAAGASRFIDLDANAGFWGWTTGTITIATGTGLVAFILSK